MSDNSDPQIEIDRETDGRYIAEVPSMPGVMAYGRTEQEARDKVLQLIGPIESPQPIVTMEGTLRACHVCSHRVHTGHKCEICPCETEVKP